MPTVRSALVRAFVSAAVVSVAALALAPGTASAGPARGSHRAAKAAWTPDGTVRAITVSKTRVFIAGDFTHLSNAATGKQVKRVHVAAFRRDSGALVSGFHPHVNGSVDALAVLKRKLVLGGDFTSVAGQDRQHLAAVNSTSGAVLGWKAPVDGPVFTLLTMGSELYVGGDFEHADGVFRSHLFALDRHATLSSTWPVQSAGTTDHGVYTLAASADRRTVLVGGSFHALAGSSRRFVGSISAATGKVTHWAPKTPCEKGRSSKCFVHSLTAHRRLVYAGVSGPGGHVVAYRAGSGRTAWSDKTSGDVSSVAVEGKDLVIGGHFTKVREHAHTMFAEVAAKSGRVMSRRPHESGPRFPGVLVVAVVDHHILLGGAFTDIVGQHHYGILPR